MAAGGSNEPEYERLFGSESPEFLRVDADDGQERHDVVGQITEFSVEKEDLYIAVDFKVFDPEGSI